MITLSTGEVTIQVISINKTKVLHCPRVDIYPADSIVRSWYFRVQHRGLAVAQVSPSLCKCYVRNE